MIKSKKLGVLDKMSKQKELSQFACFNFCDYMLGNQKATICGLQT